MTAHDVLPLITVSGGIVALVLGFLVLAVDHNTKPFLQRAATGLLMFGLLASIDEACRCAIASAQLDWRLTLFVLGLLGAWSFRVFPHFKRRRQ